MPLESRRPIAETWRALSLVMSRLQATAAASLGLAASDLKCLDHLCSQGATTPRALCEVTGHTAGAVTGMVDRLEAAGFAARARDPKDGRRVTVKPVRAAIKRRLAPLNAALDDAFSQIGEDFTAAELRVVARYLERSVEVLDTLSRGGEES